MGFLREKVTDTIVKPLYKPWPLSTGIVPQQPQECPWAEQPGLAGPASTAHPEVLGVHVQLVTVQLGQLGVGALEVVQVLDGLPEGGQHLLAMGTDHGVASDSSGAGQVPKGGKEPLGPGVDDQQPGERWRDTDRHRTIDIPVTGVIPGSAGAGVTPGVTPRVFPCMGRSDSSNDSLQCKGRSDSRSDSRRVSLQGRVRSCTYLARASAPHSATLTLPQRPVMSCFSSAVQFTMVLAEGCLSFPEQCRGRGRRGCPGDFYTRLRLISVPGGTAWGWGGEI
uniref:Uncharacterized protein n=1 Tax=Zonotrichia albicollis TaxID=44394 RepID=A0A8D2MIX3_ZONAL